MDIDLVVLALLSGGLLSILVGVWWVGARRASTAFSWCMWAIGLLLLSAGLLFSAHV